MRRLLGALAVSKVMLGSVATGMQNAHAAGIVTHPWMATDGRGPVFRFDAGNVTTWPK